MPRFPNQVLPSGRWLGDLRIKALLASFCCLFPLPIWEKDQCKTMQWAHKVKLPPSACGLEVPSPISSLGARAQCLQPEPGSLPASLPAGPALPGVGAAGVRVQLCPTARPLAAWAHCLPWSFPCTGFIFLFCLLGSYQKWIFWFKCSLEKFEAQSCLAASAPATSISSSCSAGRGQGAVPRWVGVWQLLWLIAKGTEIFSSFCIIS